MIQFLRGTQTQLNSSSQVFAAGQPIFESDSGQLKIGNGSSRYSSLPYVGANQGSSSSSKFVVVDDRTRYIDVTDSFRILYRVASIVSETTDIEDRLSYVYFKTPAQGTWSEQEFRGQTPNTYQSSELKDYSQIAPYIYDNIVFASASLQYDDNNLSKFAIMVLNSFDYETSTLSYKYAVLEPSNGSTAKVLLSIFTCK